MNRAMSNFIVIGFGDALRIVINITETLGECKRFDSVGQR